MRPIAIRFKRAWQLIWLLTPLYALHPLNGQTKIVQWLQPLTGWQGRVLVPPGASYVAVEQPFGFRVHSDGSAPAMSLVHSGYTAPDPDGKNVILAISVDSFVGHLTPTDIQTLHQQGYNIDSGSVTTPIGKWSVDVRLPADPKQEAQLRSAAALPAEISPGGATLPIQVRWSGVDGSVLYDWLANKQSGLMIALNGTISAPTRVWRQVVVRTAKVAQWWSVIAGVDAQIRWRGDAAAATRSAIEFGCVELVSTPGVPIPANDLTAEWPQILARFQVIVVPVQDGFSSLDRSALPTSDWVIDSGFNIPVSADVTFEIQPGQLLLQHPELVQDLTGSGTGLGALKAPQTTKH